MNPERTREAYGAEHGVVCANIVHQIKLFLDQHPLGRCFAPGTAFLLREDKWAYIQYEEDASRGIELYDMVNDPKQYTNLAATGAHQNVVEDFKAKFAARLKAVRSNDLGQ